MKLTEKCKEDFLKYLGSDRRIELNLPEVYLNALIIDFFDSVNIRIGIDPYYDMQGTYRACVREFGFQSMYRNVAINNAIEKANELYNNL